jgi:hypothetical protein
VIDIAADESALLLERRVQTRIAHKGDGEVVVVAPFREMISEFETGGIGRGVFEINDHELFVRILGEEEWGWGLA